MGKTLMGSTQNKGNIDLLTPEQKNFLSSILGSQQEGAQNAYSQFLQPYNPEQFQDFYQKSFIDPAQQTLQRQIIPGLKENFLGLDESGSSSLNRALAQSATDLSSVLGQGMLGQYNQQQQNQLGALGGLQGLSGAHTFQPLVQQNQGLLGPIVQAAGTIAGGAAMASSIEYKENIRPLKLGLEQLKKMKAYLYDYKPEISNRKENVGVMIEDSPSEIVIQDEGLKKVDLYALISFLVDCVNELNEKVETLEAR